MWRYSHNQQNASTQSSKKSIVLSWRTQTDAVGVCACASACMKAVARVGRRCINITYCINMVEALDWMQPRRPGGKKAERGRRSAPPPSLLQIGFPLKEQRRPTTSPVQNKTQHAPRTPGTNRSRPAPFTLDTSLHMQIRLTGAALGCSVIKARITTNAQLYVKLFLLQQEGSALVATSCELWIWSCMTATRCLCCSGAGLTGYLRPSLLPR